VAVTQPSSPSDASDIVDATDPLRFTKGFALTSCSRNIQIYQAFNKQSNTIKNNEIRSILASGFSGKALTHHPCTFVYP
jgi:hypothetical protein